MNGPEIFSLIKTKKDRIEELIDPTTFVLNKEVEVLHPDRIPGLFLPRLFFLW